MNTTAKDPSAARTQTKTALHKVSLLRASDAAHDTGDIFIVDSAVLHADMQVDPYTRCLSLYQSVIEAAPLHHYLVLPPPPPSAEHTACSTAQLLEVPHLFRSFLTALLHASSLGSFSLLLPAVKDKSELCKVRQLIGELSARLYKEGIGFDECLRLGLCLTEPLHPTVLRECLEEVDFLLLDIDAFSHTVGGLLPALHHLAATVAAARALRRFTVVCGALAAYVCTSRCIAERGADAIAPTCGLSVEISNKIHTKNTCKSKQYLL